VLAFTGKQFRFLVLNWTKTSQKSYIFTVVKIWMRFSY
jgi:hypothetical protein